MMPDSRFSFKSVYAVAKKEFMDNVRNKWIIALVIIFMLLTVLASYLAAGQRVDSITATYDEFLGDPGTGQAGPGSIQGIQPGFRLILNDEVAFIIYQYNPILSMNGTHVWFKSAHANETEADWYNSTLGIYFPPDIVIEGNHTANYSVGDTMEITFHIIEVDSVLTVEELWDSQTGTYRMYLPADIFEQTDGTESSALGNMEETVLILISFSSILIPIIAIMLGYATISGETESGALHVVLAYPVRRSEVLLGKFFGLGLVIVAATILGFGLGGIVIAAIAGAVAIGGYLAFIGLTILLGLLFLSMAILFSAICKRRSTSIAAGVLLFFWGMIIGMIIFGLYYATGGTIEDLFSGTGSFPDWIWAMMFLSPMDMTQMATMQSFGLSNVMGFELVAPGFVTVASIVLVQVAWMLIALTLAYYFFKKRDI
jgi:ABC-type transport system involved in multi-copper enzyme maturation permease subunit